jgi:hypothetical protein
LPQALEIVAQIVTLMDSDPDTAGATWTFGAQEMAPYAARYGVTLDELEAKVRSHPVLGVAVEPAGPDAGQEAAAPI